MDLIVIDATRTGAFRVGDMIFPVNSLKMKVEPKKDEDDGAAAISFFNVVTGELEVRVRREQIVMPDGDRPFSDVESGDYFDPTDALINLISQMFAMMSMGAPGEGGIDAPTMQEYETFRDNIFQQVLDLTGRVDALETAG